MRLTGLYAITQDGERAPSRLCPGVAAAIAGGARMVQYREKSQDHRHRRQVAEALLALCRHSNIPFVINDDVDLAATLGADGLHIGRDDTPLAAARARLGPEAIIGVSCYNELALALAAQRDGADYIAFGSFFASPTKPLARRATPELLRRARPLLKVPIVAIGGITPENGSDLISAGADMLAVITGVFCQPDVTAAARSYSRLFAEDPAT